MTKSLDPFRLLLVSVAGWMNQRQQQVVDYLREENRVLREQLGTRPLRFDDDQRRRLAVRAKLLGRRVVPTENSIPAGKCPRAAYVTMLHARFGEQPVEPVCC